jgi:hypothetical protein
MISGGHPLKGVLMMKIYHSALTKEASIRYRQLKPDEKLHALVSYGRRDKNSAYFLARNRNILNGLIMDSGTWTKNNSPTKIDHPITLEGYRAYVGNFEPQLDFYVNFDADFTKNGFKRNFSNQLYLERAGLKPVPVVHDCYGNEINRYIARGHKLIAIGSGELKHASLDDLRMIVEKPYLARVKVHFLGITDFEKLAYIPVYSCDASTWGHQSARGRVFYWNPAKPGYKKIDKISFYDVVPARLLRNPIDGYRYKREFAAYIGQELGFSIDDLRGKEGLANREVANLHFYAQLEKIINQKHKEQGFTFD